jgi:hypothetical protein
MYAVSRPAPPKRALYVSEGLEEHLTEAAVMIAFAVHLLVKKGNVGEVTVCPDGEHATRFEIVNFLASLGFNRVESLGSTEYGGRYQRYNERIIVNPSSGLGDVTAYLANVRVVAECKGGIINTRHPGQKSKLTKGLSELIGQLMKLPINGDRQVAVCPDHTVTRRLAEKLAPRCLVAGIEIALVAVDGAVTYVSAGRSQ